MVEKSGYHQPRSGRVGRSRCGCDLTTDKGAYRDMTIEMPDGAVVHFYHQSPVVVEKFGVFRLDNCGYQTSTTKQRINTHAPVHLVQRDFEWYLTDNGDLQPFENGMVVEADR